MEEKEEGWGAVVVLDNGCVERTRYNYVSVRLGSRYTEVGNKRQPTHLASVPLQRLAESTSLSQNQPCPHREAFPRKPRYPQTLSSKANSREVRQMGSSSLLFPLKVTRSPCSLNWSHKHPRSNQDCPEGFWDRNPQSWDRRLARPFHQHREGGLHRMEPLPVLN
ncbi:hypothetical protein BaRGS_00019356 [Batillaria attramentaria]|uniref:Uncharacterized protein n=1 Tax=Batillaria attramentaria TaxID=370345 RepID=A0ABD0KQF9_9CAEN